MNINEAGGILYAGRDWKPKPLGTPLPKPADRAKELAALFRQGMVWLAEGTCDNITQVGERMHRRLKEWEEEHK